MFPGLIIRSSSIHAAGCYTMRPIKTGVRICEYDGQRMSKAAAEGALSNLEDPQDADEQIAKAVQVMLNRFPPKPKH